MRLLLKKKYESWCHSKVYVMPSGQAMQYASHMGDVISSMIEEEGLGGWLYVGVRGRK